MKDDKPADGSGSNLDRSDGRGTLLGPGPAAPTAHVPPSGTSPGAAEEPPDPLLGAILADRYRVIRKVGEGGMGTVYEAEHTILEKRVAIKVLHPEFAYRQDLRERFLREAKAASRIDHENIVDITDFGETPNGSVFFAMEFLEGMDLATLAQTQGPLPWERARDIVLQVCRALAAAHSKGIVHRDLKPENIFLVEKGGRKDFVKVVDFGIAKLLGLHDEQRRLTKTGMIFGTPDYMSPEQAAGRPIDHRADIYALGVIFYELVVGQPPFQSDTFMGTLTQHMFDVPKSPSEVRPDLPRQLDEVILKALEKRPEDRYQSMEEFAAALQELDAPRPSQAIPLVKRKLDPPASEDTTTDVVALPARGSKRRWFAPVAALAVLVGAGAAGVLWYLDGSSGQPVPAVESGPGIQRDQVVRPRDAEQPPAMGASAASSSPDAGTATSPGDSRRTVTIRVTSRPSGAKVFLDGELVGRTPLVHEVARPERRHVLKLAKQGYRESKLLFVPSRRPELRLVLKRERHGRGRPRGGRAARPARDAKPRPREPAFRPRPGQPFKVPSEM